MGKLVNIVQDGKTYAIPEEQLGAAVAQGFRPETPDEHAARITGSEREKTYGGLAGKVAAGAAGIARGATLGLSDVGLSAIGEGEDLRGLQEENPTISTIGAIGGAVAPALFSGGATAGATGAEAAGELGSLAGIARATPSAIVSRQAARIAAIGKEGGAVGKAAASAVGGAYEGALNTAGAYLSDVALEKRDLSAEGFVASLRTGALLGGGIGGVASLAEGAVAKGYAAAKNLIPKAERTVDEFGTGVKEIDLEAGDSIPLAEDAGTTVPTRSLFPKHEMTGDATKAAEQSFHTELDQSVRESDLLGKAATDRLEEIRLQRMQSDTDVRQRLNDLKVQQAEHRVAAQKEVVAHKAAQREAAELRLAQMKAKTEPAEVAAGAQGVSGDFGEGAKSLVKDRAGAVLAPSQPATDLEAQLRATKSKLDEGASLSQLSGGREADLAAEHATDATVMKMTDPVIHKHLDDYIAAGDPEFRRIRDAADNLTAARGKLDEWIGKYGKAGSVGKFERNQATRDWATEVRPKESGFYEQVPMGEGNVLKPRGREYAFRGTAEEQSAAEQAMRDKFLSRPTLAEDVLSGAKSVEKIRGHGGAAVSAEDLIHASNLQRADRGLPPIGGDIADALRARLRGKASEAAQAGLSQIAAKDLTKKLGAENGHDIAEAVSVIGNYERAVHDVMESVKPAMPLPSSQRVADGIKEATARKEAAHVSHAAASAEDAASAGAHANVRAAIENTKPPAFDSRDIVNSAQASSATKAGKGRGVVDTAKNIGTVIEVLHSLGVPGVPNIHDLPVIGPLLSMYLKARAAATVFRRLGGKVPATIETKIASTAASTRTRAIEAVQSAVDLGGKIAKKAKASAVPAAAQILGRSLLDDKDDTSKNGTPIERRVVELAHYTTNRDDYLAQIRKSIPTRDPEMSKAIADVVDRKMTFLDGKAPKDPRQPALAKGKWSIPPGQVESFARSVRAVEEPMTVFDDIARGRCSPEAAEALKVCYPEMYAEAQQALISKAPDLIESLRYGPRQNLHLMFGVPLDQTQTPQYLSWISTPTGAASTPDTSLPGTQPAPGTPPQPGIVADVSLSRSVMTDMDRRAQR